MPVILRSPSYLMSPEARRAQVDARRDALVPRAARAAPLPREA
jgi:hypothetical protein